MSNKKGSGEKRLEEIRRKYYETAQRLVADGWHFTEFSAAVAIWLMDEAGRLRANLLDALFLLLDDATITLSRAAEMYGVSLAEMRKLWQAKREGR